MSFLIPLHLSSRFESTGPFRSLLQGSNEPSREDQGQITREERTQQETMEEQPVG